MIHESAYPIGIDIESYDGSEVSELVGSNEKYEFHQGDASDFERMRNVFEGVPVVDGLVNNAGLLGGDRVHGGRNLNSWYKLINAHATSAFVLTELCYPKMSRGGSIVNNGSIELDMPAPDIVLYTSAKGALYSLTVYYSTFLGPSGIRVNMVSPDNVNTRRNVVQYTQNLELIERFEGKTPLRRSVEPDEVADLILFLLSDRASAITGQNYRIDCGYTGALLGPNWTSKDLGDIYGHPTE